MSNSAIPNLITVSENEEFSINCLLGPNLQKKKALVVEFTCKHHKVAQNKT